MPREFEVRDEILLDASPAEVWEAIATGPGIDSWFMGRTEIEPNVGGRSRLTLGGFSQEATITDYDPERRFAFRSDDNPDGSFMAFEYLIEARDQGSTLLRLVHNGMLSDDWDAQYDSLSKGDGMYLRKLKAYLAHFPGRTAKHILFTIGPQVTDHERVWNAFRDATGVTDAATGAPARVSIDGIAPAEGFVAFADEPDWLSVRTNDGIYMFIHGYKDTLAVEYHGFASDVDGAQFDKAWQYWLERTFA